MDQLFPVYVWELLLNTYVEFAGRLVLKVLFEHFSYWTKLLWKQILRLIRFLGSPSYTWVVTRKHSAPLISKRTTHKFVYWKDKFLLPLNHNVS